MAKGKLKVYQAKRDFSKTAEPRGDRAIAPAAHARFVVQKHAARRLHFDFRLEIDGVFKSWAVAKGPSLNPKDKRLAVQTEDHPLDYGDFEGTIPKGEYGGGTVLLWDRGYWAPEPGFDPQTAIKKGELKFVMSGERLEGSFVLVRLKRRERDRTDNWLLIKHRDEYARDVSDEIGPHDDASVASGRKMADIAAGKGKKPAPFMLMQGMSADAVWHSNKNVAPVEAPKTAKRTPRRPAARPEFVEPQLCRLADKPPRGPGWAHEIKLDGYRMQMRVENGKANLRTRTGLDWTSKFPEITAEGSHLPNCMIDGEICALNAHDEPNFSDLQAALSAGKTGKLVFFVFDCFFLENDDLRNHPLEERKARLEKILAKAPPRLRYVTHLESDGEEVWRAACQMSVEGIVSKRLNSVYRGGRSDTWMKSKCRPAQEIVIGGWTEDKGRFRSLLAGAYRDDRFVYLGRVGTGFSQKAVEDIYPKLKALKVNQSPFAPHAELEKPDRMIRWARPELVAEIEFAGWTND
ncbi:MAG: non-homologous end-joining DNA ligase, partial [Caulobacterales bacterium]